MSWKPNTNAKLSRDDSWLKDLSDPSGGLTVLEPQKDATVMMTKAAAGGLADQLYDADFSTFSDEELITDLDRVYDTLSTLTRNSLRHAIVCGGILAELQRRLKEQKKAGTTTLTWGDWCDQNGWPVSTVVEFKRVWEHRKHPAVASAATISEALAGLRDAKRADQGKPPNPVFTRFTGPSLEHYKGRKLEAIARRENKKIGTLVTEIVEKWLDRQSVPPFDDTVELEVVAAPIETPTGFDENGEPYWS